MDHSDTPTVDMRVLTRMIELAARAATHYAHGKRSERQAAQLIGALAAFDNDRLAIVVEEDQDACPLGELQFETSTLAALSADGISTRGDLRRCSAKYLLSLPDITEENLEEIRTVLAHYGQSLQD